MNVLEIVAVVTGSGVCGWCGTALFRWWDRQDKREAQTAKAAADQRTADMKIEEHRDALTFQLLEAARVELADLRHEVSRLRPLESHLLHFEESLRHLEAILLAQGEDEIAVARRQAQAFLNRMRRLREAAGTIRNEVQRLSSAAEVVGANMEKRAAEGGGGASPNVPE